MLQQRSPRQNHTDGPSRREPLVEFHTYIRILRKNWLIIVAGGLAGLLLGLGISALMTPKYESTTTLYVSVRPGASATGDLYQGASFAQTAVTSYVSVATTAIVLDQVLEELNSDQTAQQLEEQLTVTTPANSVLITITAVDSNPEAAANIANTTGSVFIDVVENEIEISAEGQDSPVQVRTLDPGVAPDDPTSPNLLLNAMMGLLVGGLIGVGIAVLRGIFDSRIHSVQDLEQLTATPVVGRIAHDEQITRRPLVVHDDPRSPRAEAFRTLRTNLHFLGAADDSRVFVVSSATPSEGKTHVVANLAVVLAESGASVALVEADLRKPRLAQVMGIEGAVGLSDVLIDRAKLDDVLQPWGTERLTVLPAGQIPPNPSELLGSPAMEQLLEELSHTADYVLVDVPPLLPVTDAAVLSAYASGTLLVTAIGQTKRQDLEQAIESLDAVESNVLGIIINRVPAKSSDVSGFTAYSYDDADATGARPTLRSS